MATTFGTFGDPFEASPGLWGPWYSTYFPLGQLARHLSPSLVDRTSWEHQVDLGGSIVMGLPPHGWLIREHLMKIDELGVYLHLWNLHIYVYIYMAEISCNNNHILGIDIPVLDKLKKTALRRTICIKSRRDFTNRTHVGGHNGKQLGRTPVNPKRKFPLSPGGSFHLAIG